MKSKPASRKGKGDYHTSHIASLWRFSILSLTGFLAGCTLIAAHQLNEKYGPELIRERIVPAASLPLHTIDYWKEVKPILDKRCVVCHSCYDSPCQLKLTSPEGVDRGASKNVVYRSTRIVETAPTRLGVDANTTQGWRNKEFFPVLNEREQTREANLEASVLYRMLKLKRENPLPKANVLKGNIDFSLDRSQICPTATELPPYEIANPQWGMPFGFPGINEQEFNTLRNWLADGAFVSKRSELPAKIQTQVAEWENFLNGASLKEQLMSRYLFEHLYLADLNFENGGIKQYFKLVRSKTPPGEPVAIIPTRRPTEDPEVSRPYYRLVLNEETPVSKIFMPYPLGSKRMKRFRELFLDPEYDVTALPSYDPEVATNPFQAFQAIPPKNRYRFMLDEAQFFISGFMKGPVCRGQLALNVINDQFWVLFVDPDKDPTGRNSDFLAKNSALLRLPAEKGSSLLGAFTWGHFEKRQKQYLKAKRKMLKNVASSEKLFASTDYIWDGDGHNQNAALTVFRHFDSASVVRGLAGPDPKTVWIIGYPLLERIHYLLAVDFDVYGNYAHQILTRLYMDFMRVEAENSFLLLLPKAMREAEHGRWYRGLGSKTNEYTLSAENFDWIETGIRYQTDNPKHELLGLLQQRVEKAFNGMPEIAKLQGPLHRLATSNGPAISLLPESSLLRVHKADGNYQTFSLLLNRSHKNVAILYLESLRLMPEEDTMTVLPGFVGAHPNAFFTVEENELENFVDAILSLKNEANYSDLLDKYGIRRTNPEFWSYGDWFQQEYLSSDHKYGSLLDFSRFENR